MAIVSARITGLKPMIDVPSASCMRCSKVSNAVLIGDFLATGKEDSATAPSLRGGRLVSAHATAAIPTIRRRLRRLGRTATPRPDCHPAASQGDAEWN